LSKPQKEPQRELYYRDVNFLYEVFEKFENLEDFKRFLRDLLTPTELRMVPSVPSLHRDGYESEEYFATGAGWSSSCS